MRIERNLIRVCRINTVNRNKKNILKMSSSGVDFYYYIMLVYIFDPIGGYIFSGDCLKTATLDCRNRTEY